MFATISTQYDVPPSATSTTDVKRRRHRLEHLFMEHCAACHGDDATAGAPGDIRGLGRSTILSAMAGVEEMPSFGFLDDAETDALILWLDHARDE
jgi:mono/diheme cytochrome c family protein